MIRRAFPFLGHTLVAGAGWALVMTLRPPLPAPSAEHDSPATAASPATSGTRTRQPLEGEGGRLLRELMEKQAALEDFRDISPAADRAAAAMAAIQAWRAAPGDPALKREASARLAHWLEADPKAVMTYWNQQLLTFFNESNELLAAAAANLDLATLLTCLEPPENARPGSGHSVMIVLSPLIAKALAATGSASQLEKALEALHPSVVTPVLLQSIQAWPEDRLESLAPLLADSQNGVAVQAYFVRLPGSQQLQWLQNRFATDAPVGSEEAALRQVLVHRASDLPMQQRIEWIALIDQSSRLNLGANITPEQLIKRDVTDWLNRMNQDDGSQLEDWRHRLQHEQLTAGEILADVKQALPTTAAGEPALLLRTVFEHIAQHDAEGAMGLLESMPAADREKLMLDSAFNSGGAGNPQALLDLVSTLPFHSGSDADERFKVWLRAANPGVASYGDSYGAWVLAMPHGVERDMALSALAAHFDADDPKASADYRAAKTLPEEWKPAQ